MTPRTSNFQALIFKLILRDPQIFDTEFLEDADASGNKRIRERIYFGTSDDGQEMCYDIENTVDEDFNQSYFIWDITDADNRKLVNNVAAKQLFFGLIKKAEATQ